MDTGSLLKISGNTVEKPKIRTITKSCTPGMCEIRSELNTTNIPIRIATMIILELCVKLEQIKTPNATIYFF
ncbi:hypothetical protein AWA2013_32410 (plasmid) [Lactiplantibacillus plantarum]|nr:hypothetical protein AWA2013_32410 [Lactiplantibacillus plantarum]